jgi:glutamine synthetase
VGEGSRKRKLLNLKNTVDALPELVTKERDQAARRSRSSTSAKMHARYEIFLENYNKTINIEGQLMVLMANRYILPAALEYQKQSAERRAVKAGGGTSVQGKKLLSTYTKLVDKFKTQTDALRRSRPATAVGREAREVHARQVVPAMAKLREIGDEIEVLTPHETWPLPTYREMLFVK